MLRDLAHEAVTAVSSVDGKLLRTLRTLILRPGELTAAYAAGRRTPYIGPLPLFLAANALFFAVQSASHVNILASPLASHLGDQDWQGLARALTERRLEANGMALAAYAPLFDQAAVLNAKALIVLMPAVFFLAPALLFARRHRPLALHGVFALHLYAFLLLLFCACLAVSVVDVMAGGRGLAEPWIDVSLSLANLAACATYPYRATAVAYDARGWPRVVKAAAMTVIAAALVIGYRFSIFLITLWTT
ncbi:MAG TPA: DUF3667 domain-containing protein [Brevundimonas sp.]|jgi:hypothetical protein